MKVSVFGTGNMGRAIGTRLVSGGNDVQVLATEPQKGAELVEELRGKAASGAGVEGGASGDPVGGDVVVLAVWYDAARSIVEQQGEQPRAR